MSKTKSPALGATRNDAKKGDIFIRASGLAKGYRVGSSSVKVFEDLSLEIKRGEMIAIVGPSGAGKSTLLHILGGLDRPDSGSVIMDKFDICKLSDVDLARIRNSKVGFVFQYLRVGLILDLRSNYDHYRNRTQQKDHSIRLY